jgi:hypothetical protein
MVERKSAFKFMKPSHGAVSIAGGAEEIILSKYILT